MFINGEFHKVSLCTKCMNRHPRSLSCWAYQEVMMHRALTKDNTQKLKELVAPIHHVVPDAHNVILWRGQYYDLTKQLKDEP